MKMPKYMRIQGRETSYRTGKPVGVFVLNWRRVRDKVYSPEDVRIYEDVDRLFKEILPEPPFYGDDNENPDGAVTWFKTDSSAEMLEKIQPLVNLLDKYGVPYDIVYSNFVGKIIYEDEFQVGVIDE